MHGITNYRSKMKVPGLRAFLVAAGCAQGLAAGAADIPAPENMLTNPGFEAGLTGWDGHAGAMIESSTIRHTGTNAVAVARTATHHGVRQNMLGKMVPGQPYFVSAWARTDSATNETVMLSFRSTVDATADTTAIATESVASGCWVWLSGYYTVPLDEPLNELVFFVSGPMPGVKLYVDNAYVAPATGLRKAAAHYPGLRLGSTMGPTLFPTNVKFASAHAGHFHMASTENETKFKGLQPSQNTFTYAKAESIIDFSLAHGGTSRGHCLVWHGRWVPSWVTSEVRTPAAMRDILWNHIDTVTTHFRGRLSHWDVVNEAMMADGSLRSTTNCPGESPHWYDNPGIGYATNGAMYIAEAFKHTRLSDPDAKLFYNDFDCHYTNSKSDAIYYMLSDFVAQGIPIDGFGIQTHLTDNTFKIADNYANLQRFQDLGLDLQITELDVSLPVDTNGFATADSIEKQGQIYFDTLGTALGFSNFKLCQIWGIYDGYTWIYKFSDYARGQPLLFDFNIDKKPAFWGVWNALNGQAEKAAVLDGSADNTSSLVNSPLLRAAAGRRLNAYAANDFITLQTEMPFKGEWNVKIGMLKASDAGQVQLAIAPPNSTTFTNIGLPQDTYSASQLAQEFDLGMVDFPEAGDWQFRFSAVSKHVLSAGLALTIDYIRLSPVHCSPRFTLPPADQTIPANSDLAPVLFLAEDDTASGSLVVTATSSNTALVPDAHLVISGASPYFTIAATPLPNKAGQTTITLLANDGTLTATQTVSLVVLDRRR